MCKFNICNEKKIEQRGLQWANYGNNISWGGKKMEKRKCQKYLSFCFLGDVSAVATGRLLSFDEFLVSCLVRFCFRILIVGHRHLVNLVNLCRLNVWGLGGACNPIWSRGSPG